MAETFITTGNLARFKEKTDALYQAKELKTGSKTDYKVLSDNNLTDAMVAQIGAAASKTGSVTRFTAADVDLMSNATKIDPTTLSPAGGQVGDLIIDGHHDAYNVTAVADDNTLTLGPAIGKTGANTWGDLAGQPTIGGKTLAAGDNTLADLGIEAAGAAAAARTGAVDDVKKLGYDTAASVDKKVSDLKTELTNSLAGAYEPKGSTAFADLVAVADATKGDVWNLLDAFTTTADFVEGAGHAYPAGTNIVCVSVTTGEGDAAVTANKWDALSGVTDLSGYIAKTDLTAATDADIDALFA
ncbi:hypothetical protein [Bifidobacterium sp. SO4]|uniref:hypothetical protein n=1 Tax=Bifidobacterium sp. SO4 TaxID=2809030 RepID=UPI001BDCC312|nr:hypothetical protein [Bifidobacterium sp. SO4]MBT1171270.1 hypothetical protein [Bifidobacterium sp. SO4]